MASLKWKLAARRALAASASEDPFADCGVDWNAIPVERALIHRYQYHPNTSSTTITTNATTINTTTNTTTATNPESWTTSEHWCKLEPKPFAKGSMRTCYRLKKLSSFLEHPTWDTASAYVAKQYTNTPDQHTNRQLVQTDVRIQMLAKWYAEQFNTMQPPKKVDVMQVFVLELPDRKDRPCFCVERYLAGHYTKYSSNVGYTDDHRSTPHAFSHFTFERSQGRHLVVDIQGVGDLYTDPQIHAYRYGSAAEHEDHFGEGNLGLSGYAHFFHTHQCNSICRHLDLRPFQHYPYLAIADAKGNTAEAVEAEMAQLRIKTHWRAHSKMSRLRGQDANLPLARAPLLAVPFLRPLTSRQLAAGLRKLQPRANSSELADLISQILPLLDAYQDQSDSGTAPPSKQQEQPPKEQCSETTTDLYVTARKEDDRSSPAEYPLTISTSSPSDDGDFQLDEQLLEKILGLIHHRIALHFLSNDLLFGIPASTSDLHAIVLYHFKKAAEYKCVLAQLALANWYEDQPCPELAPLLDGSLLLPTETSTSVGTTPRRKDLKLAYFYAEMAARQNRSRVGALKVAAFCHQRNWAAAAIGCEEEDAELGWDLAKRVLGEPVFSRRWQVALDHYQLALASPNLPEDTRSGSLEMSLQDHEIHAHMATLYETGGHGVVRNLEKAVMEWEVAAECAEAMMKAKKALLYYEHAEEARAKLEEEGDSKMG